MEEQELDILKMTVEEGTKTFPQTKKRSRFLYNPYVSLIFNPLNGFLIALIALSIGGIIAIAAPQLLAEAASILFYISAAGLVFSALSIIPFAIWGGLKYQEIEEQEHPLEFTQEDWEKMQAEFKIEREKAEADLKKLQEEQPKILERTQLLYNLVPYIPFIFNPANGILIAALAFSIAAILATVAPHLLAATAPVLLCIAAGGLMFSAVTIIPFTIWEAIKHYHEWWLGVEYRKMQVGDPNYNFGDDQELFPNNFPKSYDTNVNHQPQRPVENPAANYEGSYDHYSSTLLFVKPTQYGFVEPGKPKKNAYPTLTGFADSQLGQWVQAHYWQATIVGLGILFCVLAIGACAGFFLGNPICFDILHPVFALFQSVFAAGINGLHLPFLAILTDPFVIDVITAVFITALPLIIADNVRRVMEAIAFYSPPPQADDQNTDSEEVIENKDEEKEEFYVLNDKLQDNPDVKTWNYLVSVFDKSGTINELSKQDYSDLEDYEPDSFDTEKSSSQNLTNSQ